MRNENRVSRLSKTLSEAIKAASHLTISMPGERATVKISRNNYLHQKSLS